MSSITRGAQNASARLPLTMLLLVAVAPATAQELTWKQLQGRPDLWPAQCTMRSAGTDGKNTIAPGTVASVLRVTPEGVELLFGDDAFRSIVPPSGTDLLAKANAAWAAMTAEQQRLDSAVLAKRADLWPDTVTLLCPVTFTSDKKVHHVAKGTELTVGCFDGQWLRAKAADVEMLPHLAIHCTDFAARARAALTAQPATGPSRVLRELDGKLVNLKSGRPAKVEAAKAPEYLVLYFAAGWSAPCRKFSPQLVKLYEQHRRQAGERFQVIWVSRDRSAEDMKAHARSEGLPWLGVAWESLGAIPIVQAHSTLEIPHLVVLDVLGNVVADSYRGDDYTGPGPVLKQLGILLQEK